MESELDFENCPSREHLLSWMSTDPGCVQARQCFTYSFLVKCLDDPCPDLPGCFRLTLAVPGSTHSTLTGILVAEDSCRTRTAILGKTFLQGWLGWYSVPHSDVTPSLTDERGLTVAGRWKRCGVCCFPSEGLDLGTCSAEDAYVSRP